MGVLPFLWLTVVWCEQPCMHQQCCTEESVGCWASVSQTIEKVKRRVCCTLLSTLPCRRHSHISSCIMFRLWGELNYISSVKLSVPHPSFVAKDVMFHIPTTSLHWQEGAHPAGTRRSLVICPPWSGYRMAAWSPCYGPFPPGLWRLDHWGLLAPCLTPALRLLCPGWHYQRSSQDHRSTNSSNMVKWRGEKNILLLFISFFIEWFFF